MASNDERPPNRAWQIGQAIEIAVDEDEARTGIVAGSLAFPAVGAVIGGGAAGTATGLGGIGLAFGGGAIGISAAAAVAVPAVAVGAAGLGIFRGLQGIQERTRQRTLRDLVAHFQNEAQLDYVVRVFHLEGMGGLQEGRRPPTSESSKAVLHLWRGSRSSAPLTGLFCSPAGEFVVTYDISKSHWAYVRLFGEDKISGGGLDLRGRDIQFDDLGSVPLVLRILEREEFVTLRKRDTDEEERPRQ